MESVSTPDENLDPGSLDEIGDEECWQLLSSQPIGRVAIIVGHYPLVFPVNYIVDGRAIVYRTNTGTKLWAIHRSNVTFQIDEIDQSHRSGWSVMVKGVAQELSAKRGHQMLSTAELADATPWAPGTRDHFIRILPDEVTGRRIHPAELAPATDGRGYL
jgi:uncharacterized protein